jgi:hypothetical protein
MQADGFPMFKAQELLMGWAQISNDALLIHHIETFIRIEEKILHNLFGKRDGKKKLVEIFKSCNLDEETKAVVLLDKIEHLVELALLLNKFTGKNLFSILL